ncbi:MAG: hypothetical protein PHD88_04035 [Firmicutes bacterium]|nr:hypothetical protein [Bacillota bacterium]MDD4263804.1 hypothetical protein [Bacillota bacterium]MDD4693561.1 hypothetical protein [Bacillota bacterium]
MDLQVELEKVKLKLQASFEKLAKDGQITHEDVDLVYALIEQIEDIPEEEFVSRLNDLKKRFGVVDI